MLIFIRFFMLFIACSQLAQAKDASPFASCHPQNIHVMSLAKPGDPKLYELNTREIVCSNAVEFSRRDVVVEFNSTCQSRGGSVLRYLGCANWYKQVNESAIFCAIVCQI